MKKCSEVMTRDPVCCVSDDTVEDVARQMKTEDIGPVPVVDNQKSKKLIGIVTDRDLTMKVLAAGRDARSTRVSDVMTRDPVTCRQDDDLDRALDAMERHQIRRIPVVDSSNCCIGIIAQADVATRAGDPDKTAELVEEVSK